MNADGFRKLFDYHFTQNRRIWEKIVMTLTDEQYFQETTYSVGSVRNQCVHLLNVDEIWFSDLQGLPNPGFYNPVHFGKDRTKVRAKWDEVETFMRGYLAALTDVELARTHEDPDATFAVWEVLFHVLNHGTDHRAQLLALLYSLGARTYPQDYAFFVEGYNPFAPRKPETEAT